MSGSDATVTNDMSSCDMEERLRKKVQEQAIQISQYQSHVVWASGYARKCEERTRAVDPLAEISVARDKSARRMRSCSPSRQALRTETNPTHVISMVARHRQQVTELLAQCNKLEKRAEVAEKKASEWQHASLEARKVIEKRDKENAVLHVRCVKLQELVSMSEEQILRQADNVRRLEFFVDPDVSNNAVLQLNHAQQQLKCLDKKVTEQASELQEICRLAAAAQSACDGAIPAAHTPAASDPSAPTAGGAAAAAVSGTGDTMHGKVVVFRTPGAGAPAAAAATPGALAQEPGGTPACSTPAHSTPRPCGDSDAAAGEGGNVVGGMVQAGAAVDAVRGVLQLLHSCLGRVRTEASMHGGVSEGSGVEGADGAVGDGAQLRDALAGEAVSRSGGLPCAGKKVEELTAQVQQLLAERDALLDHIMEQQVPSSGGESDTKPAAPQAAAGPPQHSASVSRIPRADSAKPGRLEYKRAPPSPSGRRRRTDDLEAASSGRDANGSGQARPTQAGAQRSRPSAQHGQRGTSVDRGGAAAAKQRRREAGEGVGARVEAAAAVERRSRANLVKALRLLRCIKAVIEGLPEEEVAGVLTPGDGCGDAAAAGATPITQVMSNIDVAYKEAHGAALSLRSNMESVLQTVATLQMQPDGSGRAPDLSEWLQGLRPSGASSMSWRPSGGAATAGLPQRSTSDQGVTCDLLHVLPGFALAGGGSPRRSSGHPRISAADLLMPAGPSQQGGAQHGSMGETEGQTAQQQGYDYSVAVVAVDVKPAMLDRCLSPVRLEAAPAHDQLDPLRAAVADADAARTAHAAEPKRCAEMLQEAEAHVTELTQQRDELSAHARELEHQLREQAERHSSELARMQLDTGSLQAERSAARAEAGGMRVALESAQQALADAVAQLARLQTQQQATQARLQDAQEQLAAAAQREEEAQAAAAKLHGRAAAAEAAADAAAAALEQAAAQAQRAEHDGYVAARAAVEADHAATEQEVAALQDTVMHAGRALVAVRAELEDLRGKWRQVASGARGPTGIAAGPMHSHGAPEHVRHAVGVTPPGPTSGADAGRHALGHSLPQHGSMERQAVGVMGEPGPAWPAVSPGSQRGGFVGGGDTANIHALHACDHTGPRSDEPGSCRWVEGAAQDDALAPFRSPALMGRLRMAVEAPGGSQRGSCGQHSGQHSGCPGSPLAVTAVQVRSSHPHATRILIERAICDPHHGAASPSALEYTPRSMSPDTNPTVAAAILKAEQAEAWRTRTPSPLPPSPLSRPPSTVHAHTPPSAPASTARPAACGDAASAGTPLDTDRAAVGSSPAGVPAGGAQHAAAGDAADVSAAKLAGEWCETREGLHGAAGGSGQVSAAGAAAPGPRPGLERGLASLKERLADARLAYARSRELRQ
eukprot:jgi/Ulvmu1/5860/UM025_0122.1